jgi:hypothetical protein
MDKSNVLPDKILSGSTHICPKFPDGWIFDWVVDETSIREREYAKGIAGLSPSEFSTAQKDFEELLQKNRFGFPNVFMDSNIALEKYNQYFHSVPDLKILGFGLPESYIDNFFAEHDSDGFEPIRRNGVYVKLSQKEIYDGNVSIGYDLLCFTGADYCSFLCGSMESEIHDKYGVQYNQYGLISDYEPAEKVSQAIVRGDEVAEEGFWAPWLVFEIQTQ